MQLVLDVPEGDVLPAWAAEAHKRQATAVVFLNANGGRAVETLRLLAAYCVAYQEQSASGDAQGGAYQCFLTLSDPTGWTMAPGGLAAAFVASAAREHRAVTQAVVVATVSVWSCIPHWAAGYQLRSRTSILLLAVFTIFLKAATSLRPFWPR